MKKLTELEIENIIKNTCASLEFEGLEISEESIALLRRKLKGEISIEETKRLILLRHGIKGGN